MRIIKRYSGGGYWARDEKNFALLKQLGIKEGVYVLRDGSMPVYVGKGEICSRIAKHHTSGTKGQAWDHFSWFEIGESLTDKSVAKDLEALLIRTLPYYLRNLNRQGAKFSEAKSVKQHKKAQVLRIDHPKTSPVMQRLRRKSAGGRKK